MSDMKQRYLVQCISGAPSHVMRAVPGSELEAMCIQRAENGKLDALILNTDECPTCVNMTQNQRTSELWVALGCPMADIDGTCADDCPCKNVLSSPWEDQVEGLPFCA